MKAVVLEKFGGPENFKLADLPKPGVKENEVRIRISCAAFNPVDYKIRRGDYGGGATPIVLGADCSGTIDEIGSAVHGFSIGDEVIALPFGQASNGSYAEYLSVPSAFVAKKPSSLSFAQAAAVPLVSLTAYRALIAPMFVYKGDTVFIVGAGGGVGSVAVPLAQFAGASAIFTIASDEKSMHYLTNELGLKKEHIVIYEGLSDEQLQQELLKRNHGRHFDVVCDLVGGTRKELCLHLCRSSGRMTTIVPEHPGFGLASWERGSIPIAKNLSVHFTFVGAESFCKDPGLWTIYAKQLLHICELFDKRALHPPAITPVGELSVETVREAHRLLQEGKVKGKLVMEI